MQVSEESTGWQRPTDDCRVGHINFYFELINISLSNITSRDITLSNITFSDITFSDITLIWNIYPGRLRWPAMCSPSCAPPLVASSWRGELSRLWWSYLIRFHFKSDQIWQQIFLPGTVRLSVLLPALLPPPEIHSLTMWEDIWLVGMNWIMKASTSFTIFSL